MIVYVGFLTLRQGFDNLYGSQNFMPYPTYPMQYPMNSEGLAPMGLIPVELDIEGLYEDHDRRRRKNSGNEKTVSSHVHSVCTQINTPQPRGKEEEKLILSSVAVLKTEHPNEPSETEKKNTCENSNSASQNSTHDTQIYRGPTSRCKSNTPA